MKNIFTLSMVLTIAISTAGVSAQEKAPTPYDTGQLAIWKYADLGGSPMVPYFDVGSTALDYLDDSLYYGTSVIASVNPAWQQGVPWIGPSEGAGANGSTSAGYTAYRVQDFQTMETSLPIVFTADNAVANIMLYNTSNNVAIDLFDALYKNFVMTKYDIPDGKTYNGVSYETSPYGGNGLHVGFGTTIVDWTGLLSFLGEEWDPLGTYDFYFITQNTNPSSGLSATGFSCSFSGITPAEATTTPEPATLAILGFAGLGAIAAGRRYGVKKA